MHLQRTHGAHAQDESHAQFFHSPNVGAMIQLAGHHPMAARMPRQKHYVSTSQAAREKLIRRFAKRRFHRNPFLSREAFDVVETASANNAHFWRTHNL